MRDYKFRGKRIDNGEWVYGLPSYSENGEITDMQVDAETYIVVLPETVGQFIGILDKHKKEIYEGQTIRDTISDMWYKVTFDKGRYIGQVVMHGPICGGTWIDDISKLHMLFYEIIDPTLAEVTT